MLILLKKILLASMAGLLAPPLALLAAAVQPNDALYSEQLSYLNQMRIPQAWNTTTGSLEVIIAVIDSGVDMDHPDIIGNMWFNKGERALNGIDDDNNGYVDDLNGWDFLEDVSDPHPKFGNDFSLTGAIHGTAVAGIAAASANNALGIAGVCWYCKIMALRALDSNGLGELENIARAIDYAIAAGADIINMSFVGGADNGVMAAAVERAARAGVILVAAVGNDAEQSGIFLGDLDFRPLYPVCSDSPGANHILGVGSVDASSQKSVFSNYGFSCIDIMAYGDGVTAPQLYDPGRGKDFQKYYKSGLRGTSMATPMAAGVAGLVKSINPKLSNVQVIAIIKETARDIDSSNLVYSGQLGNGLIDAEAAVALAKITPGLAEKEPNKSSKRIAKKIIAASGKNHDSQIKIVNKVGSSALDFMAFPVFFRGGAEAVSGDVNGDGAAEIITGAGAGGGPQVRVFSPAGQVISQFFAYDKNFRGGVHVTLSDLNSDGQDEIITAAGGGLVSEVKVFNYTGRKLWSFSVTAAGLTGGVTVAAGDVDNDGQIEIITGTGGGSLPVVQIFDKLGKKKSSFFAYPSFFRGGVNVAVGDADGDGAVDIITAAGAGGGPQIRIFDAAGGVLGQFFAFEPNFRGGASVAIGNIDDGPENEIIVGAGAGRAAEVKTYNFVKRTLQSETLFTAFEPEYRGGVNVGTQ